MASTAMASSLHANPDSHPFVCSIRSTKLYLSPGRSRRRNTDAPPRTIVLASLCRRPLFRPRSTRSDTSGFEDSRFSTASSSSASESSISQSLSQDGYIGLFISMLALDKDPLDREQAVDTLWKYSQGGRECVDSIMQFSGCINLVVSLLRSDSCSTCEAAGGLLRTISSVNLYRESIAESGAIEEIAALFHLSSLTLGVKEQSICTLWNLSIEERTREKIVKSDILPSLLKFLDDDEIKIKEAAGGVLANLALSHHYHTIMVEAGVIPKLAEILKGDAEGHKVVRKEAKNVLLELCKDDYNKILVIEEGLIPVPVVGSEAYKSYRPISYSWPSLPDGTEIQRNSTPSRYGASELLIGLNLPDKDNLEESKKKAVVGRSRQQFLARIGAIELEEGERSQTESFSNDRQTLLLLEDGVARLVLILELEDSSAISRAARAIGDASISEHMRISFKEAGAIKPLIQLLHHNEENVKESASHALDRLSISNDVCHVIESENLFPSLFGIFKSSGTSESIKEKIINIVARIFNPEKIMKNEFSYKEKETERIHRSADGSHVNGLEKPVNSVSASKTEVGAASVDLDIICYLVDLLKTSSSNMQRKVAHILEYLSNFEAYLPAIIDSGLDSALFTVFYQRCFHGEDDNDQELLAVEFEEVGVVVEAASKLLTKLLDFEQFHSKVDLIPLLNLLRKILKSNIPLLAEDWVAACLVKIQLLVSPEIGLDYPIDMEVYLYETIPRLIEQMSMSPSLEYREAAMISLKEVTSEGNLECNRKIASLGGIFPLVELIDQVDGPALDAGLAILYNLSMDIENHNAIISAGAIQVLRRIVLSQKPQWPRALNLLRMLPT